METMILNKTDKNLSSYSDLIDSIHMLRHDTFKERLGWDIESNDGREKDSFDDMDSYLIAVANSENEVEGCWRALPTTGDYMLKTVFPELLQGEAAPKSDNIWEISRFAVKKGSSTEYVGHLNSTTLSLFASFWDFARENNIDHYVAVTTVACEKILRQANVKTRRMGEGKEIKIGKDRTIALWIDVNSNSTLVQH